MSDFHSVAMKRAPQELTAAPQFCPTRTDSKTGLCCYKEEEKFDIKQGKEMLAHLSKIKTSQEKFIFSLSK